MRRTIRIFAALFISVCLFSNTAEALSFKVIQPKDNLTVAPLRDILIKGTISRDEGDPVSFDVVIDLYSDDDDDSIRYIRSRVDDTGYTPSSDIYAAYAANSRDVNTYSAHANITSVDKWMAPDMIAPGGMEAAFKNPENKAMIYNKYGFKTKEGTYTSGDFFSAIIMGGVTKDYQINYNYGRDLTAGDYTLEIAFYGYKDGSVQILASQELDIKVGYTKGKMLGRYSYVNGHNVKFNEFAARDKDEYTVLWDYFPGYWDTYEITRRWRPNDSIEYNEGNVHAILYDVHSWNATQNVELAYLVHRGEIESPRVRFYRYDIGEPSVVHKGGTADGKLIEMDRANKMELTRVEFRPSGTAADNIYNLDDHDKYIKTDLSRGVIDLYDGELLSIFGVAVPVSCDVDANDDKSYTVKDRVAGVHYSLTDGGTEILSCDKEIALDRHYYDSWSKANVETGACMYEFKHDFAIPAAYRGKSLKMELCAYTSADKTPVAARTLTLNVKGEPRPAGGGSSGGCNAGWAVLLLFAAVPGAAVVWKKKR